MLKGLFHIAFMLCLASAPLPALAETPAPGTLLWTYPTGGPIWGSLTYSDGMVYFGSDDGNLYALDVRTRRPRWTFPTGGKVRSGPAVAEGLVYVASDDGYLYAIDSRSGQLRWRFDLKAADLVRRPPSPDTPYYDFLASSPLIHDGRIYIGSLSGTLFAVDARTGVEAWKVGTGDAIRGSPAIHDDRVYFGSWDDHLYAVDLATHQLAWRADTGGIVQSTPAIDRGRVIVGSRSARLVAYDAAKGTEAWRHEYQDGSWVESSGVVADGRVYIGSSDALSVNAYSTDSGAMLWRFTTGGWTWATPLLANGRLYIGSASASPYYFEGVTLRPGFFALAADTGAEKWRFTPGPAQGYLTGGVVSTPAVAGGVVLVGALDGTIYALKE